MGMKANYHTHTVFCDGKSTPEEVVLSAIQKGFSAIGFSGHGYAPYDLKCCMTDTEGYRQEILRLRDRYRNEIEIYLGVEEDAFYSVDRSRFDYIIGSCHFIRLHDKYYPIDSKYEFFKDCLALFEGDPLRFAEAYYRAFCDYLARRKPDIIGHFDLITKFDELDTSLFLENPEYHKIAEKYIAEAAKSGCIFEVNTGAISRGMRTSPYPYENLLYILKKMDAKLILSADSHQKDTLDFKFEETKKHLKEIGFTQLLTLYNGEFVKYGI
jgi:histidinol-phosphatase (PHP family)